MIFFKEIVMPNVKIATTSNSLLLKAVRSMSILVNLLLIIT